MAAVVYGVLLLLMRLSGKRTVGQFTPFDILVVMLLSESVSSGLNGTEDSVTGGLLAAATLIALNVLVAAVTARSARLQALGEGDPVLIGRDGRLFATALRRNHVPLPDVERALREADCDLADMKFAFLEADGGISVLKDSSGKVRQEERTSGRGCTPGSRKVLLLIDFINPLDFPQADALAPSALEVSRLALAARERGIPVIAANDNFGRWRSDVPAMVRRLGREPGAS